ncbi:hypothetical protein [Actinospica robiniae]|uniref:hypothetical protein n=1 Tax=Actinospica robiniae TaxID=304901 RepID=UPI00041A6303|nr:hypothetical protein [Actinospica robiniae]
MAAITPVPSQAGLVTTRVRMAWTQVAHLIIARMAVCLDPTAVRVESHGSEDPAS